MKAKHRTKRIQRYRKMLGIIVLMLTITLIGVVVSATVLYKRKNACKTPDTTLVEYMMHIPKQEYEEMYAMIDLESSGYISKEDFLKRNSTIYEGIEMQNMSIKNVEYVEEDKKVTYLTSFDTVAGTISFENEAFFINGEEGYKIELMSSREGMPSYPIRMESEGIIKIISILNALIQAFSDSSICLAIDELDAGIFEYILGELLQIFDESAKGQLIFTSHNLRALEMLEKESIMFSTTNSSNQYIHMKNIKQSNNLRDVYLRSITLGGQKEEIYKETSSLKIARAFRKAGRCVKNNE